MTTDTSAAAVERLLERGRRINVVPAGDAADGYVAEMEATLRALLAERDAADLTMRTAIQAMEKAQAERDAWQETAARHLRNEEWMRGLLEHIGNLFGEAARTADDGSVGDSVLLLRVPELVAGALAERDAARAAAMEEAAQVADRHAAPFPHKSILTAEELLRGEGYESGAADIAAAIRELAKEPQR